MRHQWASALPRHTPLVHTPCIHNTRFPLLFEPAGVPCRARCHTAAARVVGLVPSSFLHRNHAVAIGFTVVPGARLPLRYPVDVASIFQYALLVIVTASGTVCVLGAVVCVWLPGVWRTPLCAVSAPTAAAGVCAVLTRLSPAAPGHDVLFVGIAFGEPGSRRRRR